MFLLFPLRGFTYINVLVLEISPYDFLLKMNMKNNCDKVISVIKKRGNSSGNYFT
jgi:hypothetical protein